MTFYFIPPLKRALFHFIAFPFEGFEVSIIELAEGLFFWPFGPVVAVMERFFGSVPSPSSTEVVAADESFSSEVDVDDDPFCGSGVKPLFNVDSFELLYPCYPSHSWWPEGHLTVCFVHWAHTKVDTPKEFCELLSSGMPSGTDFFGCRRKRGVDSVGNDYMAMLGFPYRIGSWKGLKERLSLEGGDERIDPKKIFFYCVGSDVQSPDDSVKFWSSTCVVNSSLSERFSSSERAFELPLYLECADEMWKWSCVRRVQRAIDG